MIFQFWMLSLAWILNKKKCASIFIANFINKQTDPLMDIVFMPLKTFILWKFNHKFHMYPNIGHTHMILVSDVWFYMDHLWIFIIVLKLNWNFLPCKYVFIITTTETQLNAFKTCPLGIYKIDSSLIFGRSN